MIRDMNFVCISPHFPPNYVRFAEQLNAFGVNVLGLADEQYDNLPPGLRSAMREYYRVDDMHKYDSLVRALGCLTHRHGKIDRLESHNEYWLETDARLRTDFNIAGLHSENMPVVKRKSLMKERYRSAGVAVARGRVVRTRTEAEALVAEVGYPVVAKPDTGVGAAQTWKIRDAREMGDFFARKPAVDYIVEEFIDGTVCSFDGLADGDGRIVFSAAHVFNHGVMDLVNQDGLICYYSLREIPADLEDAGTRVVRAFEVSERFFHLEFFRRRANGGLVALEVNMRPPGGLTTDMFNFANDIDIYAEWARVVVHNRFGAVFTRPYHCAYVGRKFNRAYAHTHGDILARWGANICHHEAMSGIFSAALGQYGYLVRSPALEEVMDAARYIHAPG
jgi:hypothetical protein